MLLILLILIILLLLHENFIPVYVSYRSRDTAKFNDYYSGAAGLIRI